MPNYEQQVSRLAGESDEAQTEFDQAYLADPEFRAGIVSAWYHYTDRCAQANAGCGRQTIGEALGEYQHRNTQLIAEHRSRQSIVETGHNL